VFASLLGIFIAVLTAVFLLAMTPNSSPAGLAAAMSLLVACGTTTIGFLLGAVLCWRLKQGNYSGRFGWLIVVANVTIIALLFILGDRLDNRVEGSAIAQTIAMVFFGGLSAMLFIVGVREYARQSRALRTAVPVQAKIIATRVEGSVSADTDPSLQRNTSTTSWEPIVEFSYVHAGLEHVSRRLHANVIVRGYASAESAQEAIAEFRPGTTVIAYVSPAAPGEAFLRREAGLGPVVFLAFGIAIPGVVWAFAVLAL